MKKMFVLIVLLFQIQATAELCLDSRLETQPILAEGRVTPLFAHAERVIKFIFEKTTAEIYQKQVCIVC